MSGPSKNVDLVHGMDAEGRCTARSPQYRGLIARGVTDDEAARNLLAMIELVDRHRGHKRTAPSHVVCDNVA
jgi:hypothetical protein